MPATPEPAYRQKLRDVKAEQRTVNLQLAQIGLLRLTVGGVAEPPQPVAADGWQAVPSAPGLFIRPLPNPPSVESLSDYFESRGALGTYCQQVAVPQSGRTLLLAGAMLWWQQSHGPEPRRLEPGDTVRLAPGEVHSYTFLEESWCLVCLTPRLSADLTDLT